MTALTTPSWYVYAVVRDGAPVPRCTETILPGADLLLMGAPAEDAAGEAPLAALVSPVKRALFALNDPASRAADPDWVAARAAAHHEVVASLAATAACLPLGFGTLFSAGDAVRQWLTANDSRLRRALAEVGGCAEWSLAVMEDETAHGDWVAVHDAGLRALADRAAAAGPGTGFLLARRLARGRTEARAAHVTEVAAGVAARLAALPVRMRTETVGAWSLLADPHLDLAALMRPAAEGLAGTGLALRLAGPYPPYAFARAAFQGCAHG